MTKQGMTSIVIPLFNQEEFVSQAIDSALWQTCAYSDFEVIVVNDGSTDGSRDVAAGYGDRIKLVDQPNKGLSEARNTGIRESMGEFILPLDADDYIDPDYLMWTVPLMSDPQVGVVATDMQYFGLGNTRIPPRGLTLDVEKMSNELPVCSLIRRAAWDSAGDYETIYVEKDGKKVYGYEDWEMWIDILKHGWKVAVVNEPLFHYRLKPSSMVTEASTVREALIQEIRKRHTDVYGGRL